MVFKLEGAKTLCKLKKNRDSGELEVFLHQEHGSWKDITSESDFISFLLQDARVRKVLSPERKAWAILALRDRLLETRNFLTVQSLPYQ